MTTLTEPITDRLSCCKFCGVQVAWVKTKNGRSMPVDITPGWRGNVRLEEDAKGERYAIVLGKGTPASPDRFTSHMQTCERRPRNLSR
jgi:hypothetical protein